MLLFRVVPGPEWKQPGSSHQAEDVSAGADAERSGSAEEGEIQNQVTKYSVDFWKSWKYILACHSLHLCIYVVCFAANSDWDGRAAVCHGLCAEEPDRWRTGRLEAETADRLHRRTTEHLPGPLRDMVHSPFTTKPAFKLHFFVVWCIYFFNFYLSGSPLWLSRSCR